MEFSGVIFDMDGVLVDSEPLWREAMMSVFLGVGVKLSEEDCAATTGLRMDEVIDRWYARFPWKGKSKEVLHEEVIDEVIRLIQLKAQPMEGILALLESLQKSNIAIAVASSSPLRMIEAVLDRFEIRSYFKAMNSAEQEEFGKPHPAVYLSAIQKLGIDVKKLVAIEDSENGMRAAQAAGLFTVVIPDPEFAVEALQQKADMTVRSAADLSIAVLTNALLQHHCG